MNSNNTDVIFQISDWSFFHEEEENDDGDELLKYKIRLYGTTDNNKKIYVQVDEFTPYFYVKVPENWTNQKVKALVKEVKERVIHDHRDSLKSWDVVDRHDFWGFSDYRMHKFLRLIFHNFDGFRAYERVLNKKIYNRFLSPKAIRYRLYESNIEPMLRCMHIRKLDACGWAKLPAGKYNLFPKKASPSSNDINAKIRWTDIERHESSESSPFIIASFDIECTSQDGSFPQPERDGDQVIQIGTTYNYYGQTECFYKHIITLGSCDPIEGVEVESYEDERDVLKAWTKLIERTNPDIITGYNIFGFDYKYLEARSKKLGISQNFNKLGRIKGESSPFVYKELSSSALGNNELYYYAMQGRIQVDLLKVVQREYKLNSYKLDNVAAHFIRDKVTDVMVDKINNKSIITTGNCYGLEADRFIRIFFNDGLSDNSYKNDAKFKVAEIKKNQIIIHGVLDDEALEIQKYQVYWCQAKDDIKPDDIFKCQKGSSADRAMVARYCLQDCMLCNKLMAKLQVITNNMGMANVCCVPLSYIFLRGQGIKIFSLIAKKCRQRNHLIPVIRKPYKKPEEIPKSKTSKSIDQIFANDTEEGDDEQGYEGAVVLEPEKGVHFEPVPVLDYASLYPSSMIHRNLSHECLLLDEKYDNLPGYQYIDVKFFNNDGTDKTCRYAQPKGGRIGILPEILKDLLNARKTTRAKISTEPDPFKRSVLDGLQLAYKITANSLYGQTGAKTSSVYLRDIAASTTATGREMLMSAKKFAEEVFPLLLNPVLEDDWDTFEERMHELFNTNSLGEIQMFPGYEVKDEQFVDDDKNPKYKNRDEFIEYVWNKTLELLDQKKIRPYCVYGDSVTPDTPLLVRHDNKICIKTIDDLIDEWKPYRGFKIGDKTLKNKEQNAIPVGFEVWTNDGWSQIKRVIRHKCQKSIYKITTHTGVVSVTEDHSLLDKNNKIIKPTDCEIGTELFHTELPVYNNPESLVGLEKAYIYGFFLGDGSCEAEQIFRKEFDLGKYECKSGMKRSWALNNADHELLEKMQEILKRVYPDCKFKILDTLESSGVYKLVPLEDIKRFIDEYRPIFYDKRKYKIIPNDILNGSLEEKQAFLDGYWQADGCRKDKELIGCNRFDIKGQISAMNMFYLVRCLGHNVSINTRKDKPEIYRITFSKNKYRKNRCAIKKMINLGSIDGYVYDLETESGRFNAGVGEITVKNTDSIFVNFSITDEHGQPLTDHKNLDRAMQLGILCGDIINKILPYPHNLEYEKTFWPFILLSKKRYVGNKYEFNPNKYYQNSMGIVLKRRDNAPIVKIVIGGIVLKILNERSAAKAVQFTKDELRKILSGEYPIDKFIITKTLKADYKDRSKIAHVALADKMAERDPGNKPQSNDRIPYVYIVTDKKTKLQGDMVEHPDYVLEHDLKIDYLFYITNQIMKPAIQFLETMVINPEKIFEKFIIRECNRRKGKRPIEYYLKLFQESKDIVDDDNDSDDDNDDDDDENEAIISAMIERLDKGSSNPSDKNKDKKKSASNKKSDKSFKNHERTAPYFDKEKGGFVIDL